MMRIPMLAILRVRAQGHRGITLWIPLLLIWLLLAPVAILLLPVLLIVSLFTLINPLRALGIFAEIFASCCGTRIEVDTPEHSVSIKIL